METAHGKRRTGEAGAVRLRELEEAVHGVVRMKYYKISEQQIDNIIEVLNDWKFVIESFIENFILLKQTEVLE